MGGGGEYVPNSGIKGRIGGYYDYNSADFCERRGVFCGYLVNHWGHFLVEAITRLWYFLENDTGEEEYIFITEYGKIPNLSGNFMEFFKLFGIENRLKIINQPTVYRELIIPEISYKRLESYSYAYNRILNRIIEKALLCEKVDEEFPKKVFLSRSKFNKKAKNEYGLDMLDDFFARNDFSIIYPENISLTQLIVLLQNADVCASESGSCAHNLLFAREGSHTIIIERQSYPNEFQANIDVIKEFNTTYIDGYYALYPVDAANGPYLLYYNEYMKAFSADNGYEPPDTKYLSPQYNKQAVKWFGRVYRNQYGTKLYLADDILQNFEVFSEAINDSNNYFGRLLEPRFSIRGLLKDKNERRRFVRSVFGNAFVDRIKSLIKQ